MSELADTSPEGLTKLQSDTLTTFIDILGQFINQIQSVFPECTQTQKVKLMFEIGAQVATDKSKMIQTRKKIIDGWVTNIAPFYNDVKARKVSSIQQISEIKLFAGMNLWGKWNDPSVHPSTHDVIWKYMDNLNKYAQLYTMYNQIPTKMMTSIESMATSIATDIQDGKQVQPNFLELGKQVTNSIKPGEMQEFAQNMMSNMGLLTSLCSSLMGDAAAAGSDLPFKQLDKKR